MIITHIRSKGFKGFDIDEDIPPKVIYVGPNMAGKSARSGIIALTLLNYIPWENSGKDINKIVESYASGNDFTTFSTIGDTEFGKKFVKGKKKPLLQLDGKRKTEDEFMLKLGEVGAPKIVNSSAFMEQSDAKKVETLFDLYPNPELSDIDSEIEIAKAEVSRWQKSVTGSEATLQNLTKSKKDYELPAGSISECQAEIKDIEAKIKDLRDQIKQVEIDEAAEKAKAEGAKEERQKMIVESESGITLKSESFLSEEEKQVDTRLDSSSDTIPNSAKTRFVTEKVHMESIQKIIDAMTSVGCDACAATIVSKQELKKYGG